MSSGSAYVHDSLRTVSPSIRGQVKVSEEEQILCIRCPFQFFVFFLCNISTFPKWQTRFKNMCLGHTKCLDLVTDEQADVCCRAIWSLIVPFHTRFPLTVGHLLQENEPIWFGWLFRLRWFICNFLVLSTFLKIKSVWIMHTAPLFKIQTWNSIVLYQ